MSAFAPVQGSRTHLPVLPARNPNASNQGLKSRRFLSDNPAYQRSRTVVCESNNSLVHGDCQKVLEKRWQSGSSYEFQNDLDDGQKKQLARVRSLAFREAQQHGSSTREPKNSKPTEGMDTDYLEANDAREIGFLREKLDTILRAIVKVIEKISRQLESDSNVRYWFVHHTESRFERELICLGRIYEEVAAKLRKKLNIEQDRLCRICLSRAKDCLVVPCMHLEYCTECVAKNLITLHGQDRRCFTCRCKITAVLQCKVLPNSELVLYGDWRHR